MKRHQDLLAAAATEGDDEQEDNDEDDEPLPMPVRPKKRPRKSSVKDEPIEESPVPKKGPRKTLIKKEPVTPSTPKKRGRKSSLDDFKFMDEPFKKRPQARVVIEPLDMDQRPPPKKRPKHRESTSDSGFEISSSNEQVNKFCGICLFNALISEQNGHFIVYIYKLIKKKKIWGKWPYYCICLQMNFLFQIFLKFVAIRKEAILWNHITGLEVNYGISNTYVLEIP